MLDLIYSVNWLISTEPTRGRGEEKLYWNAFEFSHKTIEFPEKISFVNERKLARGAHLIYFSITTSF